MFKLKNRGLSKPLPYGRGSEQIRHNLGENGAHHLLTRVALNVFDFAGHPHRAATVRERWIPRFMQIPKQALSGAMSTVLLLTVAGLSMVQSGRAQDAGDLESPAVNRVAEKLNCPCGCMMNMACKMDPYPCQTCRRAKVKIFEMQGAGKSDQQIFDSFAAENGKSILAVGPGFMGVAGIWIAGLIGLAMVVMVIRRYLRHAPAPAIAHAPDIDPETMARIEKDLNKLD
jgi:cytochrome c-type biogenesis protein CcmH/NrfF